jgi:HAD superfamily hydrolase (TIGR01458 family)
MQAARSLGGRIRGVLLDLSGTLYIDTAPTLGAVEALNRLSQADVQIRFVTNTTKESKTALFSQLRDIGFDVSPHQIFTCLTAARALIDREGLTPHLMLEDSAMEDFAGVKCSSTKPDAVVVGLAPSQFDYEHLNTAFRYLLDGARLIAIHKSRYYKTKDGLSLGPGPFVAALENASGVAGETVGKPEPAFFSSVLDDMKCSVQETVMIGDDVVNDVGGAQEMGMGGILVQTGIDLCWWLSNFFSPEQFLHAK